MRFRCIEQFFFLILFLPNFAGITVTNAGCCGVGRNNGQITCLPFQTPCSNRNEHLFWDAFHPTEVGNTVIGKRAYNAESGSDAYPIDINRLAQLWGKCCNGNVLVVALY